MKKNYQEPQLNIVEFKVDDITTLISGGNGGTGDGDDNIDWGDIAGNVNS